LSRAATAAGPRSSEAAPELVAARLTVELILSLVGPPRLGDDLACDPLVVEIRFTRGVGLDHRAVDRDHAGRDEPRLGAERKHRAEQLGERPLVAGDKASDRRMVRDPVGGDHPVGDVLAAMTLDPTRGAPLARIGVEEERDHHRGLIGSAAVAVFSVVGVELPQVHLLDCVDHKPRQVVLGQPLTQ
jgi:hypothetical protein